MRQEFVANGRKIIVRSKACQVSELQILETTGINS